MSVNEFQIKICRVLPELLRSVIDPGAKDAGHIDLSAEEWQALFVLACNHDVAHLLGEAVKSGAYDLSTELSEAFKTKRLQAVLRGENFDRQLSKLSSILESAGIDHIPLKGAVIRRLYPTPSWRTACDIDVLVRVDRLDGAIDALTREGYKAGKRGAHDVPLVSPNGTNIELHYTLSGINAYMDDLYKDIFEHSSAVAGTQHLYSMQDAYMYTYMIGHMAKHFMSGGCGVRSVIDLWLSNAMPDADTRARDLLVERSGLSKFREGMGALARAWMGDGEYDDTLYELSKYIIFAGAYGSLYNKVAVSEVKKGGALRHALSRIFVGYDGLRYSFPSIEGKPWLTPLYQIPRWVRILTGKGLSRARKELDVGLTLANTDDRQIVDKLLGYLGL